MSDHNPVSLDQVKAAIDQKVISESVVTDTLKAYEAMREERDQWQAGAEAFNADLEALTAAYEAMKQERDDLTAQLRVSMPESEHLAKELFIRKQMLGDVLDPKHPPTAEMARLLRMRAEAAEATVARLQKRVNELEAKHGQ